DVLAEEPVVEDPLVEESLDVQLEAPESPAEDPVVEVPVTEGPVLEEQTAPVSTDMGLVGQGALDENPELPYDPNKVIYICHTPLRGDPRQYENTIAYFLAEGFISIAPDGTMTLHLPGFFGYCEQTIPEKPEPIVE